MVLVFKILRISTRYFRPNGHFNPNPKTISLPMGNYPIMGNSLKIKEGYPIDLEIEQID